MILSNESLFSNKQAITATALSTNVIDLGEKGTPYGGVAPLEGDLGPGCGVPLAIRVNEDFNNLTSLKIALEVGDTDTLGTEVASATVLAADLVAGYQFPLLHLPLGTKGRYLGVRYTVTGTAPTTGKVTAGLTMGQQTNITGV